MMGRGVYVLTIVLLIKSHLVYNKSWEEHFLHLEITMATLRSHKLFAKKEKCQFGQNEVQYMGHAISNTSVAVDPLQ